MKINALQDLKKVRQKLAEAHVQAQALAAGTAEHREAVGRFLNKQPPLFAWPAQDKA